MYNTFKPIVEDLTVCLHTTTIKAFNEGSLGPYMMVFNRHGIHHYKMWTSFHDGFKTIIEYVVFLQ